MSMKSHDLPWLTPLTARPDGRPDWPAMENCIETVPERTPEYRHQLCHRVDGLVDRDRIVGSAARYGAGRMHVIFWRRSGALGAVPAPADRRRDWTTGHARLDYRARRQMPLGEARCGFSARGLQFGQHLADKRRDQPRLLHRHEMPASLDEPVDAVRCDLRYQG